MVEDLGSLFTRKDLPVPRRYTFLEKRNSRATVEDGEIKVGTLVLGPPSDSTLDSTSPFLHPLVPLDVSREERTRHSATHRRRGAGS